MWTSLAGAVDDWSKMRAVHFFTLCKRWLPEPHNNAHGSAATKEGPESLP